jgi:hypothetical protein
MDEHMQQSTDHCRPLPFFHSYSIVCVWCASRSAGVCHRLQSLTSRGSARVLHPSPPISKSGSIVQNTQRRHLQRYQPHSARVQ